MCHLNKLFRPMEDRHQIFLRCLMRLKTRPVHLHPFSETHLHWSIRRVSWRILQFLKRRLKALYSIHHKSLNLTAQGKLSLLASNLRIILFAQVEGPWEKVNNLWERVLIAGLNLIHRSLKVLMDWKWMNQPTKLWGLKLSLLGAIFPRSFRLTKWSESLMSHKFKRSLWILAVVTKLISDLRRIMTMWATMNNLELSITGLTLSWSM